MLRSDIIYSDSSSSKRLSRPSNERGAWSIIDFGKISAGGELARRAHQNWQRLQHPAYRVPRIFTNVTAEWPGDWVARTLFHTIVLARSLGTDSGEIHRIMNELPTHLNREGFFGDLINPSLLNEQQLGSPVSWLMRALVEYHQWTGEPRARAMLDTLLRNVALPMKDWWASYPLDPQARERGKGGVVGTFQGQVGRWALTSDVGNQFELLDGLSHVWQFERSNELKAVIDAGIDHFLTADLLALQAQVHATLTTLRGLLRMYRLTHDARTLKAVEERYGLYRRLAMTESYANYNYFGRPNTWTEPCAIIDSFIVAMQLWQFTEKASYLEDAHLIWFNGVGRGQRATGGFGCDSCAGVGDPFLQMKLFYEAYFCCTMRGGEGHAYAIQSAYHIRYNELAVTLYTDSRADLDLESGRVILEQATQYPYGAEVKFSVVSSTVTQPITMRLFAPSWLLKPRLIINGRSFPHRVEHGFLVVQFTPRAGDVVTLNGTLKTWIRPTHNPNSVRGYQAILAGPLLLGAETEREVSLPSNFDLVPEDPALYRLRGRDVALSRINDLNEFPLPSKDPLDTPLLQGETWYANPLDKQLIAESKGFRRQVLFR